MTDRRVMKKKFPFKGKVEWFYRETMRGTGRMREVNLRESNCYWWDENGTRYSKDGGWPMADGMWRLHLNTIEARKSC